MVDAVKNIHQRLATTYDRQKKYADRRRRPLEFTIGDKVFLKVAPMKRVFRFGKKGKLSPRYIDASYILPDNPMDLKTNLTYKERLVKILLREVKQLRNKRILLVKVLWRNQTSQEATWEREEDTNIKYPKLFDRVEMGIVKYVSVLCINSMVHDPFWLIDEDERVLFTSSGNRKNLALIIPT
ncbi:uncharacterized protein LOC111368281 [Olea europaea var. sylvestris]|uniref:uncharacterized protein LOC111368281 n=1 Tax=Olea europaea var. sylvestris TaxID=158386 RepID=UPI000C1D05F0|nr:uncharacterized protein LOC111368281 [Olea europaea var. sylvestris]